MLFLVDRLELEDQAKKALLEAPRERLQDGHLQRESRRLAARRNRRHHGPVTPIQQQISGAFFAHRFRPGDLRRSASLHRRQRPRGLRLLHRLQAGPDGDAARLPQEDSTRPINHHDPREYERRLLLDTYRTFGCEDGQPTFRYSLLDGVKDGYLDQSDRGRCPQRGHHAALVRQRLRRRVQGRRRRGPTRRPTSSANSRSASSPTPPTSFSARPFSKMRCAIRSAARSASRSSLP